MNANGISGALLMICGRFVGYVRVGTRYLSGHVGWGRGGNAGVRFCFWGRVGTTSGFVPPAAVTVRRAGGVFLRDFPTLGGDDGFAGWCAGVEGW